MLFVDNNKITDPRINLAIEEFLLRFVTIEEPILLFYINAPSVIIGRNQNTVAEVDPTYIQENDLFVVRRLSGGGAVYHDLGNLNFSFITNGRFDLHNFSKFTSPVIKLLQGFGIDATLQEKSSIFANGKKVSGNAQYAANNRMFSHGTLLFNTDLNAMLHALNPRQAKIESNAVQSVRNFVTNIHELLPEEMDIFAFRKALLHAIFGTTEIPQYELTTTDWKKIEQIAEERYKMWEWNYGRSPNFNIQKSNQYPIGKVEVLIDVQKGIMQAVKIFGSFEGDLPISDLESRLVGCRYDKEAAADLIQNLKIDRYFGGLSDNEFITLLF